MKKYTPFETNDFKKSLKRVSEWQSFKEEELKITLELLMSGELMPPEYKDHKLSGTMARFRECHIRPDLLLVYRKEKDILVLVLVDIGSHSSLFKK